MFSSSPISKQFRNVFITILTLLFYVSGYGHSPHTAGNTGYKQFVYLKNDSNNNFNHRFSIEFEIGLNTHIIDRRVQNMLRKQDYRIDWIYGDEKYFNPLIYFGGNACKILNSKTGIGVQYKFLDAGYASGYKDNGTDTFINDWDYLGLAIHQHQISPLIYFRPIKHLRLEAGPSIAWTRIIAQTGTKENKGVENKFTPGIQWAVVVDLPLILIGKTAIDLGLLKFSQSLYTSTSIGSYDTGDFTFSRQTLNFTSFTVGISIRIRT